jgi:type IV secretory pathway VirB10-like protein
MAISIDLRILAKKLEDEADNIIASAEDRPEVFQLLVKTVAAASAMLEKTAEVLDENAGDFSEEQIDGIAALAEAFYGTDDPFLKKQASVLDELLLTLASPKNALAQAKKATEDEIIKLREKYRSQGREESYDSPRESLQKQNRVKEQAAAVDEVKRYKPLEAPLQTRYAPDYPGNMMTRISDNVWQDPMTGKLYDFKAGYTTNKGDHIPGGAVENQIPDVGSTQMEGHTMFDTREAILSRHADDKGLNLVKEALNPKPNKA